MSRALVLGGGGPVGVGWQAGVLSGLLEQGVGLLCAPPWATGAELLASGAAGTVSEDQFVARFDFLAGVEWPENFLCPAFGAASGRFAVWDREAGVDVHRAVASSCSVPGLSPPVTIGTEQYIDGGARDMLNADLAVGHDRVVALSCVVLDPLAGRVPDLLAARLPDVRPRVHELSSTGSAVELVEPSDEVRELSGWGALLMDFERTATAFDAGVRQGKDEAARLEPFWS
jgi:NTE family protein